jgi:hypothetical protein
MTKHECELMKRLMDENEQLRTRIKLLEQAAAVTAPVVPNPTPKIWPDPVQPYWPYRQDDPFNPIFQDLVCFDGDWLAHSGGGCYQ